MNVGAGSRSLFLFDLSAIPVGASISLAQLTICATSIAPGAEGRTHEINRLASVWTESGVTWNNQPNGNPGIATQFTVPMSPGCFTVDITPPIQALAMGGPNYGFGITDEDEGTALLVQYATREHPLPGFQPTLNVTFTP
jgi:hypothetical protein